MTERPPHQELNALHGLAYHWAVDIVVATLLWSPKIDSFLQDKLTNQKKGERGRSYQTEVFNRTLRACTLNHDINIMETTVTPRISRRPRQRQSSDDINQGAESSLSALKTPNIEKLTPLIDPASEAPKDEKTKIVPCLPEERRKKVEKQCHNIQQTVPGAKKMMDVVNLLPPRVRVVILTLWLLWKFFVVFMFIHIALTASQITDSSSDQLTTDALVAGNGNQNDATRILYIVTTLAEFNTGHRKTEKGQDRLGEVLIPVLVDSIERMVQEPFNNHVDVYIIAAFELRKEREDYIRSRLPAGVGLEIWDDACPLGYEAKHSEDKVIDNTRALARQHRYVIKDKLPYYDLFVAFEDDMRITGDHVSHFLKMSNEIDQLRLEAPQTVPNLLPVNLDPKQMKYHGAMTRDQMDRLIPGFIRVEVLLDEKVNGAQTELANIDRDFTFEVTKKGAVKEKEIHFNPRICCHVQMQPNKATPVSPPPQDVIIWETNIKALSALNMPKPKVGRPSAMIDWVGVLPGPGKRLNEQLLIGGYWSGRDGAFGAEPKPGGGQPDIIAQQGGWMATRSQLLRMNNEKLCMGSFVPPFDEPMYKKDGQESMNVEFWSGGYQLFTGVRGGCNMQRVISLHPDYFSSHFIYHVANNKQKQLSRERMLRADNLFGQFNTVRKSAEKALLKESELANDT